MLKKLIILSILSISTFIFADGAGYDYEAKNENAILSFTQNQIRAYLKANTNDGCKVNIGDGLTKLLAESFIMDTRRTAENPNLLNSPQRACQEILEVIGRFDRQKYTSSYLLLTTVVESLDNACSIKSDIRISIVAKSYNRLDEQRRLDIYRDSIYLRPIGNIIEAISSEELQSFINELSEIN
ncbi:MAG: hypothetical protein ABIA04_06175 [Pseudomonadota bacterium]